MSLNSFRTGLGRLASSPVGKWSLFGIGALLVFSLAFSWNSSGSLFGGGGAGPANAQAGTDVVATVNGDPITRQEFDDALNGFKSQFEQMGRPISISQTPLIDNTVLDQLVAAKLQLQLAQKMGLNVTDDQVQKARADIAAQAHYASTLSLPATASVSDIDAALTKAGSPTLEERLPDDVVKQYLLLGDPQMGKVGTLQAAINNQVTVSDQDVKDAFTQYHTRHILIGTKTRTDAQAKAQAEQVLTMAQKPGANFAALAQKYSDDTASKKSGGDDGWIGQTTQYVPEFKAAAFKLQPGQVTPTVVASPQYGYFIIKLDAVKTNYPPNYAKDKNAVIAQVRTQKQQQHYQDLLSGLQSSAKVDVKDPVLDGDRSLSKGLYQAALTDYQKALKGKPSTLEQGQINVAMAEAYQQVGQTPQALAAYEAALKTSPDPDLHMAAGDLYAQAKDTPNALKHYQMASDLAWDNQETHEKLLADYGRLGQPALAAKENAWLKKYQQQHSTQGFGNLGGMTPGGARPIIVNGGGGAHPIIVSGGQPHSAGAVQIVPTPGAKPAH